MTVWVEFVGIAHIPCSGSDAIVVADGFLDSGILGSLRIESISVWILLATNFASSLRGIDLEDSVVRTVDVRVDTQAEEMLVVVCIDSWVHFCSPALGVLTRVHSVGV